MVPMGEWPAMPLVFGACEVLVVGLEVGDAVGLEVGDEVGLDDGVGDDTGDGLLTGEADAHGPPGDGITLLCAADLSGEGAPERL
jgi:hypothetical protein